jgi:hypothetical protein
MCLALARVANCALAFTPLFYRLCSQRLKLFVRFWQEFVPLFADNYFHIGGDEVSQSVRHTSLFGWSSAIVGDANVS